MSSPGQSLLEYAGTEEHSLPWHSRGVAVIAGTFGLAQFIRLAFVYAEWQADFFPSHQYSFGEGWEGAANHATNAPAGNQFRGLGRACMPIRRTPGLRIARTGSLLRASRGGFLAQHRAGCAPHVAQRGRHRRRRGFHHPDARAPIWPAGDQRRNPARPPASAASQPTTPTLQVEQPHLARTASGRLVRRGTVATRS